ncbi:NAD(P)/FAD-dependent oxidoreductase [Streptomyces sp. NBC_01320]|uniref:NAD(P)/FAD-dependent oxidoreductase n=1 Tax=Streptomyces sp. NBC_01320 TaxID=2903824 RepID=UPI002E0DD88A|nr:FAD-dependent oxidoreductase [Streptomyces sp. NBC_01320]
MRNIIIAGGANAGLSAARELRLSGFDGSIQVVDRDPRGPYRRPETSKGMLDGRTTRAKAAIPWPEELQVERFVGVTLTALDPASRTVLIKTAAGTRAFPFDGLVIATGCEARPSPFGPSIGGVHTLRDLEDSEAMRPDLDTAHRVVIIGGGFIGLEVASVARGLGKDVTVVEAAPQPLARLLGRGFGEYVAQRHRDRGVRLITDVTVKGLAAGPSGRVASVVLSTGESLDADVVLVAIGSAPATRWLEGSGIDLHMGVSCDRTCAVPGVAGVVAAGDVASWINPRYGRRMRVEHWTNAIEQGTYAARRLLGVHDPDGFASVPYFWSDQYGVKLQSIGSTVGHDEAVVLEQTDERLLVAYGREGRLVCVAGWNAGAVVMKQRPLVLEGVPLDEVLTAVTAPQRSH